MKRKIFFSFLCLISLFFASQLFNLALAQTIEATTKDFDIGKFFIPVIVIICVLAIMLAIGLFLRNYIKVPPNQVAIISGRKRRLDEGSIVGFRMVHGGASFVWPFLEKIDYLSLEIMSIPLTTKRAITKEGVPLTVEAIANVKIGSDDVSLRNAAERFLGMKLLDMFKIISDTLEAHLRAICCTLSIEAINSDRQSFAQKMVSEAADDLKKLGIVIDVLAIQHIQDDQGYLESLGKKRTAEVKKEAAVGEAEAKRDSEIRTAQANSESVKKSTDAQREGEVQKNENLAKIAEAEKQLAVKKALFKAESDAEQARANLAGPKAQAVAQKDVNIATVKAEEARIEAEIELQKKTALRKEEELQATIIKQAEAEKKKVIIEAQAHKESAVTKAEGDRDAEIAAAEATKKKMELEGVGQAAKTKSILLAEAEGKAAIIEQQGKAEGVAIEAKLTGEAEGLKKKAEAYKLLEDSAKTLFIMQNLPPIIEATGTALQNALAPIFTSMGQGMANIDKVVIVESGGNGGGQGGITKFASTAPTLFFNVLQQARSLGFDPTRLFQKLGVDVVKDLGLTKAEAGGVGGAAGDQGAEITPKAEK